MLNIGNDRRVLQSLKNAFKRCHPDMFYSYNATLDKTVEVDNYDASSHPDVVCSSQLDSGGDGDDNTTLDGQYSLPDDEKIRCELSIRCQ